MKPIFAEKTQKIVTLGLLIAIAYLSYTLISGDKTSSQSQNFSELSSLPQNGDLRVLGNFFEEIANAKGGEYAYRALAFAAGQGLIPQNIDLHLLGHRVGDVLYKQVGMEGIKFCTDDLRNACSHSIVVGTLLDNGLEMLPKIVKLCEQAPGGSGAYTMCVHGLGHGVLAYTEYDYKQAISICKTTGTQKYNDREVGECIGGATMEMVVGVHDRDAWQKQYDQVFRTDDPLTPCNQDYVPVAGKYNCYVYLTPRLFQAAGADLGRPDPQYFSKAISFCDKVPDDALRLNCYGSFGKEFVVLVNARNVQSLENMTEAQLRTVYDWCAMGPQQALSPCLKSALQSLYWGGENDPDISIKFCKAIPNAAESTLCFDNLIENVAFYVKDQEYRDSFCLSLPAEESVRCRSKLIYKS